MPAEYYLDTIKTVFQDFALVNGTWHVERRAGAPAGHQRRRALLTIEGELDDISGAGQTAAAHDLCTGIPKARQFHYDVDRRRPLRHLSRAGAGARRSIPRCATSSLRRTSTQRRRRRRWPRPRQAGAAPARRADGHAAPRGDARRQRARRRAAADAVHALRLRRLPRLRRGHRRRRAPRSTSCPPGGAEGIARLARLTGRPALPLEPDARRRRPAPAGA